MRVERLSVQNLREGVLCAKGKSYNEEYYQQLEAWLGGDQLKGHIARADNGDPAGFILYYPIEYAPLDVEGDGIYMVQCLYVKPEYQDTGIGTTLIKSAMTDAEGAGAKGLAVEGYDSDHAGGPGHATRDIYEEVGMSAVGSRGTGTLYFTALRKDAQPPRYLEPKFNPQPSQTRIRVDILDCRNCYERVSNRNVVQWVLEKAALPNVEVVVHDQSTREAILDKGMSSGVFVDGRLTFFRGPVTEDDVWSAIEVAMSARELSTDH